MPKKKIGLRGDFLKKSKELSPLATTGERRIREGWKSFWDQEKYSIPSEIGKHLVFVMYNNFRSDFYCLEVYRALKITPEEIVNKWNEKYHPAGYGTSVHFEKSGKYIFVVMTRNHSCD